MSKELETLAAPKSRAIPAIIREGDIIKSTGPMEVKIVKKENDRVIVLILGDFKVHRQLRKK